jgi:hypothetical protein
MTINPLRVNDSAYWIGGLLSPVIDGPTGEVVRQTRVGIISATRAIAEAPDHLENPSISRLSRAVGPDDRDLHSVTQRGDDSNQ